MGREDADFGDSEHPHPAFDGPFVRRDMSHQTAIAPQQPSSTRHLREVASLSKNLIARFHETRGEQISNLSIELVIHIVIDDLLDGGRRRFGHQASPSELAIRTVEFRSRMNSCSRVRCVSEFRAKLSDQLRVPTLRISPSRAREVVGFEWTEPPGVGVFRVESRNGMAMQLRNLVAENQIVDPFCTGRRENRVTEADEIGHERGSIPLVQIIDRRDYRVRQEHAATVDPIRLLIPKNRPTARHASDQLGIISATNSIEAIGDGAGRVRIHRMQNTRIQGRL